ncbi:MAG: hypothetical protein ABJN26_13895 [Stappiaceae bacterium]
MNDLPILNFHRWFILTTLILLPIAGAASIILYILMATEGDAWASATLDTCLQLALLLNALSYIFAIAHRSAALGIASIVLSLIIVFSFGLALVASFPATGRRWGNNGVDLFAWIGLLCALSIFVQHWRKAASVALAIAVAVPGTFIAAHLYLSAPLSRILGTTDLAETCVTQGGIRITTEADIALGFVIGEASPRITEYTKSGARTWLYAQRKFGQVRAGVAVPAACTS